MASDPPRVSLPPTTLAVSCETDPPAAPSGSVLDAEALRAHAADVARTHGAPKLVVRSGPLLARFREACASIEDAYTVLWDRGGGRVDAMSGEEWLLDNRYVIEEQIREIDDDLPRGYLRKLPRLVGGRSARYPRVYAVCLDYLLHTDARLDTDTLAAFIEGYQTVAPLTMGELWAVPIMLRVGLLVVLSGAAQAATTETGRARGAAVAKELVDAPGRARETLDRVRRDGVDAPLLVHLWRALREHEVSHQVLQWIRDQAQALGASVEDLAHKIHLRQAADQLAIANAIASMRTITTYEWRRFFERTSVVERILLEDAGGVYSATDAECRDRYRHVVERVATRSRLEEPIVARRAMELAGKHLQGAHAAVGHYLEGDGVRELELTCRAHPTLGESAAGLVTRHPRTFFFSGLLLLTALATAAAWDVLGGAETGFGARVVLTGLLALAASEAALSTLSAIVVTLLPPRLLSRLAFLRGITPEHKTLVAVPVLFDSIETVDELFDQLEVRALANPDPDLHFCLLSDFCDAALAEEENDAGLVERAVERVLALNERYPLPSGLPKFALLHRKRIYNAAQRCFMGWERKRGKLEELNRLILGQGQTTFTKVTAPRSLLGEIKYVIALDADTDLPRAAATHLVATIGHPLNRPVLSEDRRRVVEGYAIIQPRVGTVPSSARRSRFARVAAGPAALDPYTTAVSDVSQDLFGEGSYVGKAIYDVRAFAAVHDGHTPENRLLSHDLFEGVLARTALASDIELLDEQPATYGVVARRAHRWMRGDWQLLSLLAWRDDARSGKRDLGALGLWKVVDNLRRSVLGPSSVAAFLVAALVWPRAAVRVLCLLASVTVAPLVLQFLSSLLRRARSHSSYDGLWRDLNTTLINAALGAVVLFDQAVVALDAVTRTLYRLTVSKRNLLEWQSTGLDRSSARTPKRMWLEIPFLALFLGVVLHERGAIDVALPILLMWMGAPFLVDWLGRPLPAVDRTAHLTDEDRTTLRGAARKTWRFFERFVTDEDHGLPPDNFQEEPRGVVAHRTSPTNIGLYLLAVVTARDLGYIGTRELIRRLTTALDTMDRLDKYEGHLLNWTDTKTLTSLEPKYVSTVDSGNLAAYLWTIERACEELLDRSLAGSEAMEGVLDALALAGTAPLGSRASPAEGLASIEALERDLPAGGEGDWRECAERTRALWRDEIEALAPHLAWLARGSEPDGLARLPEYAEVRAQLEGRRSIRSMVDGAGAADDARGCLATVELDPTGRAFVDELCARFERGRAECIEVADRLRDIRSRAHALVSGMSFSFLYDEDRALFSIGYNVSTARLDGSRYDLLASEARLGSFVAIAKGDVPEKHWFHLGRARRQVGSERALLSWSGSMFEYLMPLLVLRSYPDTLLDETHTAAVHAHREYGGRRGVPWGVSEAAFNVMDLSMTYQYRAFGVPALGLKPGLDDNLVVAPYATALAALVDPGLAATNLTALLAEGLGGDYGFYDSIDYTPSRVPPNRKGVVVKTYMAHHQGMALVSFASVLLGAPMQRRFHEIPRVKATELLLQERIPSAVPVVESRASRAPSPTTDGDLSLVEVVPLERQGLARVHLLGHGELAATVSSIGTGALTWRGLDIVRAREDQRLDPGGTFIYVRDKVTGRRWSAGFEPTRERAASYSATFSVDHVELHRTDHGVEMTTEIVVSPEHAVEVRRVTLNNRSDHRVELDLTSYMEVALVARATDVAHRAFSNMFVEMEVEPTSGALLAMRRPQPGVDLVPWVVQTLVTESGTWGPQTACSSRAEFLGRGGDAMSPKGLDVELPAATRHPLDPAMVLRRTVTLEPKGTARVALVTGIGASRDEVLALARSYSGSAPFDRVFELAWVDARVELKHLGVSAAQSFRFQRLLSFIVDPHPSLRVSPPEGGPRGDGRAALWSLGISGDLPLVVVCVDDGELTDLCREVLLAHEFFRLNNVSVDLLLWNEEPAGYLQPQQDDLVSLVQSSVAQGHVDQRGGVFVRRASSIDASEQRLILASARVVLRTSGGSLARQVRLTPGQVTRPPRPSPPVQTQGLWQGPLRFENGVGGFTADGREYVVVGRPPAPWSNVLANAEFGTLITERGGGFTWSTNSQRLRLTPWSNDAVCDPTGEAIYLTNAEGQTWRATDGAARHAVGRTTFEGRTAGVRHTLVVSVPMDAPVKLSKLVLENETDEPMHLSITGYVEWVLGGSRESSRLTTSAVWDGEVHAAFAQNAASQHAERCSFFRATRSVSRTCCDRAEFFRDYAPRARPSGFLGARPASGHGPFDPCTALGIDVVVPPHATVAMAFVLGDGRDRAHARELASEWADLRKIDAALEATDLDLDRMGEAVQVETPDPAFDLMVNRWLLHQVLACRLLARSAFYQSGGAYGYRDQLQDSLALVYARPDLCREHILRAAARQFEEGDVQHWWHPDDGAGIRTNCSDDMLWLAYATVEYVARTGDRAILDEQIPFLSDRPVPKGQRDLFATPRVSRSTASLYEHCTRALDVALTAGPHGIPLMRGGDWNDGFDRVGSEGRGESVWLGWFLLVVMDGVRSLAHARGDQTRVDRLGAESARLRLAMEEHAWDGAWYRRGYFDDGSPLGSETSTECRIDAIAQSWSVFAGARIDRASQAVREATDRLVREDPPMMQLLAPAFEGRGPDPGYIRAYPPGIRENGGQYTHGVLWTVQALASLGEHDRAYALLTKLIPIHHAGSLADVKRYAVEPYVLAGDVYSATEHDGRGGWSWYTGAAAWMYRIALETLLGVRIQGEQLSLKPAVPSSWSRYSVRLRRGRAIYEITVRPGDDLTVELDGVTAPDGMVHLVDDGQLHAITARSRRAAKIAG